MFRPAIPTPYKARQHGAFSILAAFTLLILLMFLVLALDSGRLYMQQRQLQKVADMAALESISRLPQGNCSAAPEDADLFARQNAQERHGFLKNEDSATLQQSLTTQCVRVETGADNLRLAQPDEAGPAVQVTASHTVPSSLVLRLGSLFGDMADTIDLQAVAVAERETPAASFSVGAQLLRLNNSRLLGQLLKAVGLDAQYLTILDSDGLATASITPSGLLRALGIDIGIHELKALSPEGLLQLEGTSISLLRLIEVIRLSADVVSDSVLGVDLDLLHQGILHNPLLKDIELQLFGTDTVPGLLQIKSALDGTVGAALDTSINLGELLGASILIGVQQSQEHANRGLVIDGLNVLGLAKVELGIVEPPSIGVGPVGTKAYNAQVRLYVGVDTNGLLGGILSWLTDTILGTRINLPIWIDVVSGEGTLTAINCEAETPTADILVETDIINACIGKMPEDGKWSTSGSCEVALQEDELIKLLHIPVLSGKTHIPALRHDDTLLDMTTGETRSTTVNPLALGETVEGLVGGLLDLLSGLFRKPLNDDPNLSYSEAAQNKLIENLAKQYLEVSKVNGFYDVDNVTKLILQGSDERDADGNQVLPPLVDKDWGIPNSIPVSCALFVCPPSAWQSGTFTEAFHSYTSIPYSLLDVVGIPTLGKGYRSCAGLLSSLLNWNGCVEHNLAKLLKDKPDGINMSANKDGEHLANPNNEQITCSGVVCILLKPVLALLKPILNGIGKLLTLILADVLGLELGRTDVTVHSISCGTPQLVR
ncbi:pilus assembly protein TadG-related protein [Halopseudomonas bauzanensis]|uniref:pilus assembly protein TadG-related protein n=1 Tax=Halopseudomonas bauzanensis TaxID=653930 RepID=UPI00352683B5